MKGSTLKTKFGLGKRNAKSRYHKWHITFIQYKNLVKDNKCHYCLGILSKTGTNLDRKDHNLDYTINNVVPCCRYCNVIKNKFMSYEEMFEIIKTLQKIRKTKDIWYDIRQD